MIKIAEGQKVKLEEGRFATITSEGTLILEYTSEGPLGQDRIRTVGISTVGAQALLDLLANGEAVEHSVQSTPGTPRGPVLTLTDDDFEAISMI